MPFFAGKREGEELPTPASTVSTQPLFQGRVLGTVNGL